MFSLGLLLCLRLVSVLFVDCVMFVMLFGWLCFVGIDLCGLVDFLTWFMLFICYLFMSGGLPFGWWMIVNVALLVFLVAVMEF